MPETRKHHVQARDELDEAVFAALGEPIRPAVPGQTPPPTAPEAATEASAPTRSVTFVTPGTMLGGFSYGRGRPVQP
ncbi:MAG: hypothetical protein ACLGHZ_00190 [Actinomycetes bacterium]